MIDKTKFISRAAAARMLRVTVNTVERLAARNGIEVWQVPGHSRKWFRRADVEQLVAAAAGSLAGSGVNS